MGKGGGTYIKKPPLKRQFHRLASVWVDGEKGKRAALRNVEGRTLALYLTAPGNAMEVEEGGKVERRSKRRSEGKGVANPNMPPTPPILCNDVEDCRMVFPIAPHR